MFLLPVGFLGGVRAESCELGSRGGLVRSYPGLGEHGLARRAPREGFDLGTVQVEHPAQLPAPCGPMRNDFHCVTHLSLL